MLHHVGWADQLSSPGNSVHHYETVHAFARANTTLAIDQSTAFFPVPWMNHWYAAVPFPSFLKSPDIDQPIMT